jgi:hypothetical protein
MAKKDYDVASEMLSQKLSAKGIRHKVSGTPTHLVVRVYDPVWPEEIPKTCGGWKVKLGSVVPDKEPK